MPIGRLTPGCIWYENDESSSIFADEIYRTLDILASRRAQDLERRILYGGSLSNQSRGHCPETAYSNISGLKILAEKEKKINENKPS